MLKELELIRNNFLKTFASLDHIDKIKQASILKNKVEKEQIDPLTKQIKNLSIEEKKIFGPKLNNFLKEMNDLVKGLMEEKNKTYNAHLPIYNTFGKKHIIPQSINRLKTILITMGYEYKEILDIDLQKYCFDLLNVTKKHPARDNFQSFYLEKHTNYCLIPHSSSLEAKTLMNDNQKIFTINHTFRRDSDKTHTPMFHQMEIVRVGKEANVKSLLVCVRTFLSAWFERPMEIRVRPNFFPFTNISLEIDIKMNGKWLEILGSGIMAKQVFQAMNTNFKNSFALGCGLERLIMLKYNLKDIRELYEGVN